MKSLRCVHIFHCRLNFLDLGNNKLQTVRLDMHNASLLTLKLSICSIIPRLIPGNQTLGDKDENKAIIPVAGESYNYVHILTLLFSRLMISLQCFGDFARIDVFEESQPEGEQTL